MSRYEKGKEVIESIQKRSLDEIFEGLEDIAPDIFFQVRLSSPEYLQNRDGANLKQ